MQHLKTPSLELHQQFGIGCRDELAGLRVPVSPLPVAFKGPNTVTEVKELSRAADVVHASYILQRWLP